MTTAPMSLSAARFSAAQPSFQQHSLAKNTTEAAFTQAECTRWRTDTQVPITRPTPDKLSFREPNGLPSNKPQPVECSPAGSMRRRILDGLVTSPVTIEPILEGSPLYGRVTTTMYGSRPGIHTSICMREYAEMPEPDHTVISLSRESHSHSTSHTSHRTNFVGGHSKRSTVQTVRPFTSAFAANVRRGKGPHTYIYVRTHAHTSHCGRA